MIGLRLLPMLRRLLLLLRLFVLFVLEYGLKGGTDGVGRLRAILVWVSMAGTGSASTDSCGSW
jgi:hypothetical protein